MRNLMNGISIRRCTRDELSTVMSINERTLPENYPQFFYESIIERFPESFLVAQDEYTKQLVGYVMFRVERNLESGLKFVKKGHLVSIAVLKEFQGKKIGERLLIEGMKQAKNYGVDLYVLEVRISNTGAISLYKKLKFIIEKTIPEYYRDGEDAYYMVLKASDFKT
ncbi:MAG: GNAT family N-acetyltransferase [Candidatus Lokiarchaeota archaeon]|nr:GNAT family N-acetyltransferase [Candidatus Lokiarchaeota archaeon]